MNPFIVKGASTTARGLRDGVFGDNVFESLMARSADEPFTLYGLTADSVRTGEDRSWVEFTINPKARFSDGVPVTVDDVIFSFEILRDKGRPNFRAAYGNVGKVERIGARVGCVFKPTTAAAADPALMPVLRGHAIDPHHLAIDQAADRFGPTSSPRSSRRATGAPQLTTEAEPPASAASTISM
jgi:peptide/nickel transport system substrate-binding protein